MMETTFLPFIASLLPSSRTWAAAGRLVRTRTLLSMAVVDVWDVGMVATAGDGRLGWQQRRRGASAVLGTSGLRGINSAVRSGSGVEEKVMCTRWLSGRE